MLDLRSRRSMGTLAFCRVVWRDLPLRCRIPLADDQHSDNGTFAGPSAEGLVRLIPVRQVSSTGAELVDLSVLVDGRCAAALTIAHLWHSMGTRCAGLYAVVSPGRLNGTVVSIKERAFDANQVIRVRVSGARHDRVLSTGQIEDYVLASDFTYDDLRFFTPRPVLQVSTIECEDGDNTAAFILSAHILAWQHVASGTNARSR